MCAAFHCSIHLIPIYEWCFLSRTLLSFFINSYSSCYPPAIYLSVILYCACDSIASGTACLNWSISTGCSASEEAWNHGQGKSGQLLVCLYELLTLGRANSWEQALGKTKNV